MSNVPIKTTQEKDNISNLPMNITNNKSEANKKRIKAFSNSLPQPVKLEEVAGSWGISNLFTKSVTAKELNLLIENLQKMFKQNNEVNKNIIREFYTVYDTFESLDKSYIQGILASIASANEAAQQADAASTQALEACEKARVAQERINMTVNVLQDVVDKYQDRFEKVDARIEQQGAAVGNLSVFIKSEIEQQKLLNNEIAVDLEAFKNQFAEPSKLALDNATIAALNNRIKYAYAAAAIAIAIACASLFMK